MYKVEQYEEQSFKMYRLIDEQESSWITVCPERGGIITGFGVEGEEQLYLNKETLYDSSKNIRGGIPILFPISGQLEDEHYEWNGRRYKMPNHGVARINDWTVMKEDAEENQASITIQLTSSDKTKEAFPFDFELVYSYILEKNKLTIMQRYHNLSDQEMPMYPGFHPYFKSDTKTIEADTDAESYLDYNDNEEKTFNGSIDLEGMKESVALVGAKGRKSSFRFGDSAKVQMETGPEFAYTVLWTEAGKEFICIEPWMAKNAELNRGEELVKVPAGEMLETFVSFTIK